MITNCVRTLRKTNGYNLTQAELARQIGVARQTIVELENGRSPSADLLLRISKFFDMDSRDIFQRNHKSSKKA
ncbi:helix-turn-helix transcriptional regulator [Alkalihalobacillus pseudalcaliphilus]|uniref:helix-turn-helix transcriptional regulator n=1 Tax=Alkalihalobacillus pseudalcaliphilus TaxID=79884 RepID=UPI00064DCACD|nr:helix-turn-helix domain-containing protein [Alkalihalobacillus pseudalcaliphilus]KMK77599.1 hypothetical protein AB990_03805 [Alkalihalobacillus pseudalcaliphilus]